jgi:Protein of unknown function (DUF3606)
MDCGTSRQSRVHRDPPPSASPQSGSAFERSCSASASLRYLTAPSWFSPVTATPTETNPDLLFLAEPGNRTAARIDFRNQTTGTLVPVTRCVRMKAIGMANKQTSRGRKQDRGRVAGGQDYEVRYEAKKTGKSRAAVKKAVKKVGPGRKRVERALSR